MTPALRSRRRPGRGDAAGERDARTARAVGGGGERLWPWWLERQLDVDSPTFVALPGGSGALPNVTGRSWTLVGTRSGRDLAAIDPRGLVTPVAGGWSLDWWVGADDRWHLPAREVAVRQRLVDGAPVVETAMRVPGGDVVATAWAAQASSADGGAEVVVVEIANATPVPVALALAVRPYDGEGVTAVRSVALREGGRVDVDGRPALALPRPPARAVLAAFADGDPCATVVAGDAPPAPATGASVRCPDGLAAAAFVVPLTHGTSVRVVLATGAAGPLPPPASLPPPAAVARGWRTHVDAGARLALPDDGLAAAVATSRCSLLLTSRTRPRGADLGSVAGALDELGHPAEAASLLAEALAEPVRQVDGAVLEALDRHVALAGDRALAERSAPTVAAAAEALARRGGAGLDAAARVLLAAGEDQAAAAAERAFRSAGPRPDHDGAADDEGAVAAPLPGGGLSPVATLRRAAAEVGIGDERALGRLRWALDVASPTGAWPEAVHPRLGTGCGGAGHSLVAAAELLRVVRRLLVCEDADGLVLLPVVPESWRGQGLEVHALPTTSGTLAFAVRWHGARPALLWEVEGEGPVRLRAPGLDPAWSSTERRGEALLAAPSVEADVQGGSFA